MKKITLTILIMLMAIGTQTASAAWVFDIASGSAPNSYDFVFDTDGDSIALEGYTFVFNYSGANLVGSSLTPPSPLITLTGQVENPAGTVRFDGFSFSTPATLAADYTFATFTFDAPAVLDWATDSLLFVLKYDGVEYNNTIGVDIANVPFANTSAVPLPGALWLLGSGLLGLVGWRRKSSK